MRHSSPVGRDTELAALARVLRDARRGHGSAVVVSGEAGIGKSRLVTEAVRHADDLRVLRGHASPATPFRPFAEALLSVARAGDPTLAHRLGPYRAVLGRLVPDWAEQDPSGTDGSLVVLAEAVLRLLALAGERAGCLLVIEDLHDADPETVAVLDYLVANLAGLPVAVVVTTRHGTVRGAAALPLHRLGAGEVRDLVAHHLDVEPGAVPADVADLAAEGSGGVPLLVEELVRGLVARRDLTREPGGWRLRDGGRPPTGLVQALRARLGQDTAAVLAAAAVVGNPFPGSVVARVTGAEPGTFLRSGLDSGLLVPHERGGDWYAFSHPLSAGALAAGLTPCERAATAAGAARVVAELHPDLPGHWCELAARLAETAGHRHDAVRRYVEVARRARGGGAPGTALSLVDHAEQVLGPAGDPDSAARRRELLDERLRALADAGEFDRARAAGEELVLLGGLVEDGEQRAVHVRTAWAAWGAGRWAQGRAEVARARALPGAAVAEVDAVDAYLTMGAAEPGWLGESRRLAVRAAGSADPAVACQAWYAVGFVSRASDLPESTRSFHRMLALATEHGLAHWRILALVGLGGNRWLADGEADRLRHAHEQARSCGAIGTAHGARAILGLDAALRGDHGSAESIVDECLADTARLHLDDVAHYARAVRAVIAAHRGRPVELAAALAAFRDGGGESSREVPLVDGLAVVFAALLDEDRPRATGVLGRIAADHTRNPTAFYLAGHSGLGPLLDAMAGRLSHDALARITAGAAGGMRWNRQFLELARAVLLGRDGRPTEAAMNAALETAAPFPLARVLGLRLVAERAIEDGWGRPREWLREAENHFHRAGVAPVAGACRSMLRRIGEPVRQRRTGTEHVPESLRGLGVTVREFEVLRLLPSRQTNRVLAERLHISPRTVEKHVASLLTKTGLPSRLVLVEQAADLTHRL